MDDYSEQWEKLKQWKQSEWLDECYQYTSPESKMCISPSLIYILDLNGERNNVIKSDA